MQRHELHPDRLGHEVVGISIPIAVYSSFVGRPCDFIEVPGDLFYRQLFEKVFAKHSGPTGIMQLTALGTYMIPRVE